MQIHIGDHLQNVFEINKKTDKMMLWSRVDNQ
jgi:hypothetical protein